MSQNNNSDIMICELADGKSYALGRTDRFTFELQTTEAANTEDLKTLTITKQPALPAGINIVIDSVIENCYGKFIVTYYDGHCYYLKPQKLCYLKMIKL